MATLIFFIKEFYIHAAGAVCHSTFIISTSPFQRSSARSWLLVRTRLLAFCEAPEPVLDFGPERGSAKGTMADLGPLIRHLVSTKLPSGRRAAFLSPLSRLVRH